MESHVRFTGMVNHINNLARTDTCHNRQSSYIAIIVTVLPLWAILTALISFVLLSFHKNLRSTKIYDNCVKSTASHVYLVEIRTGETSPNYHKRRAALTVDMFDDNQNVLTRIAIPGHIIFGRRDQPVPIIEDDKYADLRVTRFWLYRAARLRHLSTIRLTHTSPEPEARIMVYGLQLTSCDVQPHKLFFPVTNFITAYGSVAKPNAIFDIEAIGSISAYGGEQSDSMIVSEHLSWIDTTLLLYILLGTIALANCRDILFPFSLKTWMAALYKGLAVGPGVYIAVLVYACILRYLIKSNYAHNLGVGTWSLVYHSSSALLFVVSTVIWVYLIIETYKELCPDFYSYWLMSVGASMLVCAVLQLATTVLGWMLALLSTRPADAVAVVDNDIAYKSGEHTGSRSRTISYGRPAPPGGYYVQPLGPAKITYGFQPQQPPTNSWPMASTQLPPPAVIMPNNNWQTNSPFMNYKTMHTAFTAATVTPPSPGGYAQPQTQTVNPGGSYPNHTVGGTSAQIQGLTTKAAGKRVGSRESTGSSYYQQLMKNKGGVKSISQYGELLRQKKPSKILKKTS